MVFSLLFLAAAAADQPATQQAQAPAPKEIIVTGRRRDLKAALDRCIARNCPTPEDVDATLGYAEDLFVSGEYDQAHDAIRASIRRNHDKARQYPEPVSDLYRSDAKVARHLGLDDEARRSTRDIYTALKQGLPVPDVRHFTARVEMVSQYLAFGQYQDADDELRQLEREARSANREDIAQMAQVKRLWVNYLQSESSVGAIRQAAAITDPKRQILAKGAQALLAQVNGEKGKIDRDTLLATVKSPSTHRILLYAPPYELATNDLLASPSLGGGMTAASLANGNTLNRISDTFNDSWIDVDFWIDPAGRVTDLQLLRQGSGAGWAAPLLESIRARRYSASSDGKSTHRLERYTYTAGYEARTGSRMKQRSPRARVEYMDLTMPAAAPAQR